MEPLPGLDGAGVALQSSTSACKEFVPDDACAVNNHLEVAARAEDPLLGTTESGIYPEYDGPLLWRDKVLDRNHIIRAVEAEGIADFSGDRRRTLYVAV